jgi:hypothetical protein
MKYRRDELVAFQQSKAN